ncbi:hypothetical protein [Natrinema sp. HArc-T2]|uniref:hypothetical protein n=1 Tax=Natrinema sp. HArc-T2 TaxID=3242701 RepID=UPI00359EE295
MSANGNGNGDEIPGREVAYRLFAAEYDDASLSYAESDEERAPNYVISPTGARLNRVFVVGTLTEVTSVNDEMVRARVVDPTGAFVVYAGQYQPDELAFLEQASPPAFVAVTGKARTFQPDDSDQVYTSIRPESIAAVDADTRDRWVVSAAERTLERVGTYAGATELDSGGEALTDALREAGIESGLAAGIPLAQEHYGTTPSYLAALRDCALEAVEVVADERDQVSGLDLAPDATSPEYDVTAASLANLTGFEADALEGSGDSEPEFDAESTEPVAATTGSGSTAVDSDAHAGDAAGTATTSDDPDTAVIDADLETETAEDDLESDAGEAAESSLESETVASDDATADTDTPAVERDDTAADASDEQTDDVASAADDDLGDFDAGDVDDGMYEMDEAEREQLEEEFGAEFTTGSEVDDPGKADIDVPDPEDAVADEDAATEDVTGASEADVRGVSDDLGAPPESGLEAAETDEADDTDADADDTASDDDPADDVDLDTYVIETMEALDDGDGADRTELIETVVDDTGASAAEVEDAIQDALMGGQCYEPNDETLKAI